MNIKNATFYEKEIDAIKKELKELPEGHLTKRGTNYYITVGSDEKGITKDPRKISQLARKAFLLKKLKNYEWNLSLIKRKSWQLKPEDPESIIHELPKFYQTLPSIFFCHSSAFNYLGDFKKSGAGYEDKLVYITDTGVRVRSKSERMIADSLDQAKIPYCYEVMHAFDGKILYPDFVIFRPFDGKLVIWEHFGRMDDEVYKQNAIDKMITYVEHGYYPFDNLICTYEHDMKDPAYLRGLINLFILR